MPTSSPARPMDRRIKRSRQSIRDSFVALTLERGYEHVSVEEIIQGADVARATFYAHYTDKHDVLAAIVRDLADDLTQRIIPLAPTGGLVRGAMVRELFRHVDEQRELYRVTLSAAPSGQARAAYTQVISSAATQVFTAAIDANGGTPRIPVAVLARAWTGSHTALVEWWLNEEPQRTADEVTIIAMQLLIRGYVWAGGLEPGALTFDDSDLRSVTGTAGS
ncbi:MAG: TetR/AcrR family transcriptional regulator [Frankiales bacterium]|nr:TetR/AcrR family transcriptional regulator [Frankiales bacterium]